MIKSVCKLSIGLLALLGVAVVPVYASHNMGGGGSSTSASLSTDTVSIAVGASGSWTISGNDGGSQREFRWSLPSGLNISTGSSSNMNRFRVRSDRGYLQVQTNGGGSFSATVNVSSNSASSYVMNNQRADISLNPNDVTVNVADSGGGGGMGGDGGGMGGGGMGGGGAAAPAIPVFDATNVSLVVRSINRTMNDGNNINFWVFCEGGMGGNNTDGMAGGCTLPSPVLELGVNQTANINLNMMMAPQEPAPYNGHTIHPHGVDVAQSEDGVPETGAPVNGDTYTFSVDSRYVGSHMYHCHVHTVKHLEMGMYGALIVKDGSRISNGGPSYDVEWNMVLSTVDPAYHTATGDSTVFADYNPRYFLIYGQEGLSNNSPAEVVTAAPGDNVAIRLIGIHSTNSTFEIRDSNGSRRSFTVHNIDGFALPNPRSVTSLEVSPGQTKDVMVTLPNSSGTWYPEVSYRDLRNNSTYSGGRVYTQLDF